MKNKYVCLVDVFDLDKELYFYADYSCRRCDVVVDVAGKKYEGWCFKEEIMSDKQIEFAFPYKLKKVKKIYYDQHSKALAKYFVDEYLEDPIVYQYDVDMNDNDYEKYVLNDVIYQESFVLNKLTEGHSKQVCNTRFIIISDIFRFNSNDTGYYFKTIDKFIIGDKRYIILGFLESAIWPLFQLSKINCEKVRGYKEFINKVLEISAVGDDECTVSGSNPVAFLDGKINVMPKTGYYRYSSVILD